MHGHATRRPSPPRLAIEPLSPRRNVENGRTLAEATGTPRHMTAASRAETPPQGQSSAAPPLGMPRMCGAPTAWPSLPPDRCWQ